MESGSAHVFVRDPTARKWSEAAKLTAIDETSHDHFAWSMALSGDTAVIGACLDDDKGTDSGSVYVFLRDPMAMTWSEKAKLTAGDGAAMDVFGFSVALSENTVLAGAIDDDDKGQDSGSAYVFVLSAPEEGTCAQGSECATGFCVDGVCCDTACLGTCESCSTLRTGAPDGTCAPILAGLDPDDECVDQGEASCGTDGLCDGDGACQMYPSGTECAPKSCMGATLLLGYRNCDGKGTCEPPSYTDDCAPFACDAGACLTMCATDAQCAPGVVCVGGECKGDPENGGVGGRTGGTTGSGGMTSTWTPGSGAAAGESGTGGLDGDPAPRSPAGCAPCSMALASSTDANTGIGSAGAAPWLGLGLLLSLRRRRRHAGSRS